MSQLGKDPVTGQLVKNAVTGRLVNGGCGDCEHCDFDYEQYQITFSGISSVVQNQCYDRAPVNESAKMTTAPPTVNTTFTVTRSVPGSCIWVYVVFGDYGTTIGSNDTVCGDTDEGILDTLSLGLTKASNTEWSLSFRYINETSNKPDWNVFNGDKVVASLDCYSSFIIENGFTGGIVAVGTSPNLVGSGGIATITPII